MTQELGSPSPVGGATSGHILLVGQSPLPAELRGYSQSGILSVEIRMDPSTGTAKDVSCRELTPAAAALLGELLVGKPLQTAWEGCRTSLQQRYFGIQKDALLHALDGARRQFTTWSELVGAPALSSAPPISAGPAPASVPTRDGPSGSNGSDGPDRPVREAQSRSNGHHNLATLLVTLLAHSKLLDGKEWRQPAGAPLSTEVRRQAVQIYAVVQQILHSVEAEPGLLQPQIEPILLQPLVERALGRSTLPGHRLTVNRLLSPELTPARGDRVVLEEALVMLFDEIGSYTDSAGASLEITAEKRRADILLTIELRDDRATPCTSGTSKGAAGNPSTLLEQIWRCGLGTLAARALVEHQGGRLWMQESFPKDMPSLCLALPAHQPQEGADQHQVDQPLAELPADAPIPSARPTRVTALWR